MLLNSREITDLSFILSSFLTLPSSGLVTGAFSGGCIKEGQAAPGFD